MFESLRILILEDNPADAELVQFELQEARIVFTPKVVMTEEDFVRAIQEFSPNLILSDYDIPRYNGALALAEAKKRCPDIPFILVTGAITEELAIEILTQGANDYVLKKRLRQRLVPAVSRALAEAEERRARKQAEEALRESHRTLEEKVKIRTTQLETEIAERKKAEEQIAREKYLQQLLLDHFPGVVLLLRTTTREVVASNQAGINVGAVCGSKCYETWSQIQNPCPWCLAPELWATGKEQHVVLDAGEKVFEAHWVPVADDLYMHYAFDITERKRSEEKLHEKDRIIQQALSISNSFTFDWDTNTDQVHRSESCRRVFGIDSDEMCTATSKLFSQRVHPEDRSRFEKVLGDLTPASDKYTMNFRLLLSDGSVVTLEETAQAFFDDMGRTKRVIGVATDITARNRAVDALRDTEERHRRIVEALTDAVLLRENERIIYANPAALKLFRANDPSDLLGKLYLDLVHPDDRAISAERMKVNLDRIVPPREHRVLTLDGQAVHVESVGMPIQYRGQTQVFGVFRDITNRKRAEKEREKLQDQLLQSQKMESVGRLAGGVAHDFNNMLGVIIGHAEMAMEEVDPAQSLHADLEEIRKAANRSADLTRQLLAFARKQTVSPKVLDLNETVEGMLKMLRRLIGEDIQLAWLPGASMWPVKMDPSQIDQILANLSVNSRDAIAGIGKVTIETQNAHCDEAYCVDHEGCLPGDYVLLAVSDDGCGMDKETQSKLFEPFFTTKETGKGTGLGLATVYGIVKQNNGFINVYSEPGQGTTFKIYLPRHIGRVEKAQMEGQLERAVYGHETILVVEDEPSLLGLSESMLEKQGYRVLAASTPGEAIRLAEEYPQEIHLLMTDVVMPEMNGRELAKKLLSLYPNMKRLFMSGYTADVIAHHGVLDDGVHFLQKPFSKTALFAKVREALEGVA